jgi:hypothetical protein
MKGYKITIIPLIAHLKTKGFQYNTPPELKNNKVIFHFPPAEGLSEEVKKYHEGSALCNPAEYADALHRVRVLVRNLTTYTSKDMEEEVQ